MVKCGGYIVRVPAEQADSHEFTTFALTDSLAIDRGKAGGMAQRPRLRKSRDRAVRGWHEPCCPVICARIAVCSSVR